MNHKIPAVWLGLCALAALPLTAKAIFLGQIDDFTDGSTGDWAIGNLSSPFAPVNISSGGPFDASGSPDAFLQLSSSGASGAGSKLVSFNINQWTEDFIGAGVTGISLYFNNTGSNAVTMRLGFFGADSTFSTQQGFSINPGSGWQEFSFDLTADDVVLLTGSASFAEGFANIVEMRILSSANPAFSGDLIAATVGVDNITAIPEPSSIFLLLMGTAGWALAWRIKVKRA